MQQRWLKKQLLIAPKMTNVSDFLKKLKDASKVGVDANADSAPFSTSEDASNGGSDDVKDGAPTPSLGADNCTQSSIDEDFKEASANKEEPKSPARSSNDESFLDDADGNGSIAEAIGRT